MRHFLKIRQSLENGDLDNAYWLPDQENTAHGATKVNSEMIPFLRLSESGAPHPGILRRLKSVSLNERATRKVKESLSRIIFARISLPLYWQINCFYRGRCLGLRRALSLLFPFLFLSFLLLFGINLMGERVKSSSPRILHLLGAQFDSASITYQVAANVSPGIFRYPPMKFILSPRDLIVISL